MQCFSSFYLTTDNRNQCQGMVKQISGTHEVTRIRPIQRRGKYNTLIALAF
jgi:hypothetical protein